MLRIRIIAEAGKNFINKEDITMEECLINAKQLAKAARLAGADTIKFQCHAMDEQIMRHPSRREWIEKNTRLTPFYEFWCPLKRYCDEIGINFLVTPMSLGAAVKINHLVDEWKIGSGNLKDFEMMDFLKKTEKPIIISTGMNTLADVDKAVFYVKETSYVNVMHCVSEYPCPIEHANLSLIPFYKRRYNTIIVGYSDHTLGYEAALGAVMMGAEIIEKHFTINNDWWGPDQKLSLNPNQFEMMVKDIIHWQTMIGNGQKNITSAEAEKRKMFYI